MSENSANPARSVFAKSRRGREVWGWIGAAAVAGLFAAYFRPIIRLIFVMAHDDPNWSHAFLVPLVSLYFLARAWPEFRAAPARTTPWGLVPLLAGLIIFPVGEFIQSSMVMGYAMILSLYGLTAFLHGPARLRRVRFPILYLLFAIKITMFWEPIAVRLQRLAAALSAMALTLFGALLHLEADAEGAVIQLYLRGQAVHPPLNVDEACSGLRMLMALIALATALAWMERRRLRARLLLAASAPFLAVAVNVVRITGTGLLYPFHPAWTRGAAHELLGLSMLVPALAVLLWLARWLDRRFPVPPVAPGPDVAAGVRTGANRSGRVSGAALAGAALILGIAHAEVGSSNGLGRRFLARAAVPLRKPLGAVPAALGPYQMVADCKLSERATEVLGSRRYISRIYRDARRPPDAPGAGVWVHAVYYTGSAQTLRISHTPEQCYVGRGNRPVDSRRDVLCLKSAAVDGLRRPPRQKTPGRVCFPARVFTFLPRGAAAPISAVYFFIANGRLVGGRRGVRLMSLDFRDRYAYFCKIEMVPGAFTGNGAAAPSAANFQPGLTHEKQTLQACETFLEYFLPQVIACLPDSRSGEKAVAAVDGR